ncbi:MAG: tRNA (guanosine(37)-N1)-methyltransferase TrmD [Erysipelotrichaceae bacterium]|nr:tRNA (guanosine(37)-N1)-methyltransferase TrmD [Erysipelotrichaceae bacterium]
MKKITILSITPEQFDSFLKTPLISRAIENGILDLKIVDIRDYSPGSFRKIDDSPYGGGAGMVLRCQPVLDCLESLKSEESHSLVFAPIGRPYTQKDAHRLSEFDDLILICGHYEGFDARIYPHIDEIISIGDYVLSGGELPAMVVCESIMRLVEGSMKKESTIEESFEEGLLEYPQYTKPYDYKGECVPDVLLSGNHEEIKRWRKEKSMEITKRNRPDLLEKKKEIDPFLKAYIEENVLKEYSDYEASHNIDHINTVTENAMELIEDLDVDIDMVYCICSYHDIGIRYGRKDHHITSAKWMYEDPKLRNWFTEEEMVIMKEAIEDHRASRKDPPRSIYGCIIAEADRDIDPMRIIERCVIFEEDKHPDFNREAAIQRVLEHLDEKYSDHGYLKLWMPCKKNQEGLDTLRGWMKSGEIVDIVTYCIDKRRIG